MNLEGEVSAVTRATSSPPKKIFFFSLFFGCAWVKRSSVMCRVRLSLLRRSHQLHIMLRKHVAPVLPTERKLRHLRPSVLSSSSSCGARKK